MYLDAVESPSLLSRVKGYYCVAELKSCTKLPYGKLVRSVSTQLKGAKNMDGVTNENPATELQRFSCSPTCICHVSLEN
jgi:hypothetical protein